MRYFNVGWNVSLLAYTNLGIRAKGTVGLQKRLNCSALIYPFSSKNTSVHRLMHSLAGIIIESQQLKSRIVRSTQGLFNLMFVAECLQFARSHHKVVTLASHVVIVQNIPEDFKVLRFVDSGIFTDLIEIREYAPLTCFV